MCCVENSVPTLSTFVTMDTRYKLVSHFYINLMQVVNIYTLDLFVENKIKTSNFVFWEKDSARFQMSGHLLCFALQIISITCHKVVSAFVIVKMLWESP